MKHFLLPVCIVFAIALTLLGCGGTANEIQDSNNTEVVQAAPDVDLDLVTAKDPFDTLLRTTDNVGKTVRVKLAVDKIRELEINGSKVTVAYGNPSQGIGDRITLVAIGPAWENISKGDTIEETGLVAYVDGHDGHETPAIKQLPNETLRQMIVAITASRQALTFLPHAVIVIPPKEAPKTASRQTI